MTAPPAGRLPGLRFRWAFGTGTTDWAALDECVRQGVRRFVAEFWYVGSEDWRAETAFASKYVREKIEAAFERCGK